MEIKETTTIKYIAFDGREFTDRGKCLDYEEAFTNLRKETEEELLYYGKRKEDVLGVIVNSKYKITYENFLDLTKDWFYDASYGGDCPICDWKIVGKNWWLERWEYDGSSGWSMKECIDLDKYENIILNKIDLPRLKQAKELFLGEKK